MPILQTGRLRYEEGKWLVGEKGDTMALPYDRTMFPSLLLLGVGALADTGRGLPREGMVNE